ncbi:hypothetical protein ERG27_13785 [Bacillus amyloliquefaciens]|nr:hypothetical protein BCBMB205_34780 [Bacillus velezensis]APQ51121.1 hypothetical protein BSO20_14455 [Bacillus amyloliquefaciens]ARM29419.1 hypothetical protein B9C48_16950 [Bacillus vallismortis]EIF14921.1 hypothetical protein MY7_3285 [Bacillus sp. 5B6]QJC43576.1 hypothetical protein FHJ82_17095 [Bacillus sp. HNA3]
MDEYFLNEYKDLLKLFQKRDKCPVNGLKGERLSAYKMCISCKHSGPVLFCHVPVIPLVILEWD